MVKRPVGLLNELSDNSHATWWNCLVVQWQPTDVFLESFLHALSELQTLN